MRIYQIDRLTRDVRVALDQNAVSAPLAMLGDVDTLTLDGIIRSKLTEGVKRVHGDAPAYLLDGGHNFGDAIYWKDHQSGWVLLPEDFMRLVVFEMSDWERAVHTALSVGDAGYARQSSRFKGIRGTAQRPVCVIAIRPEGRVLEFYSCRSKEATVRRGIYLPYPTLDEAGGIEICERCYEAVVYTVGALVLTALGDNDKSSALSALAKTALI